MENPIPEAQGELKPIVEVQERSIDDYIVNGKQTVMPVLRRRYTYRAKNLPERPEGAKRRLVGSCLLTAFGLTCNSCGHVMPKGSEVAGYTDVFPESYCGHKGGKRKKHMYCPKCSSEIRLDDWTIISGAEYFPPGTEPTQNLIVVWPTPVSVGASGSNNKYGFV